MKKIKLLGKHGVNKYALIDDDKFELVSELKWFCDNYGYAVSTSHGYIKMHRLITGFSKKQVDHINGNRLDNRLSNLRLCTLKENVRNTPIRKDSYSGFKDVTKRSDSKGRNKIWKARINPDGKTIELGLFYSAIEAAVAYNKAAKKYFGKFAYLNIV